MGWDGGLRSSFHGGMEYLLVRRVTCLRAWKTDYGKGELNGGLYDAQSEPDSFRNGSRECGVPLAQP